MGGDKIGFFRKPDDVRKKREKTQTKRWLAVQIYILLFVALELFIIGFAEKPLYVTILLAAFFVNCAKIDELQ